MMMMKKKMCVGGGEAAATRLPSYHVVGATKRKSGTRLRKGKEGLGDALFPLAGRARRLSVLACRRYLLLRVHQRRIMVSTTTKGFSFFEKFFWGSAFCLRRRRPRLFRLLLNMLKNGFLLLLSFSILLWASRPRRHRH